MKKLGRKAAAVLGAFLVFGTAIKTSLFAEYFDGTEWHSSYSGGSSDDNGSGGGNNSSGGQNNSSDGNGENGNSGDAGGNESSGNSVSVPSSEELRVAELKKQIEELQSECHALYVKGGTCAVGEEKMKELAALQKELSETESAVAAEKERLLVQSADALAQNSSGQAGDPIRLTTGSYLQNETDFIISKSPYFELRRKYDSLSSVVSAFGCGWIFNLDERIILGIEPDAEKIYQKMLSNAEDVKRLLDSLLAEIPSAYGVSNIASGENELLKRITEAESIKNKAEELAAEVQIQAEAVNIGNEAEQKLNILKNNLNLFRADVATLSTLEAEYTKLISDAQNYYKNTVFPSEQRKLQNKAAMFPGAEVWLGATGLNTLTIIDEEGFPHLMRETSLEGEYAPSEITDKKYLSCTRLTNGSYQTYEKDGTVKDFDGNGFLVKITHRNGNFIEIKRETDEKIKTVETSDGEVFLFEYKNSSIVKITNMRDVSQSVEYEYDGNKLTLVRDSDGDTVTMSYDENSMMTSLNKCDGSSIRIEYGEKSSDGKILATSTVNEEGFSEHFDYDRIGRKTFYTDHDGNITAYEYDKNHRTTKERLSDGTEIEYEYDDFGNLIRLSENGNVTSFSYDGDGNKTRSDYSDGSFETWEYNDFGEVSFYTGRDGVSEEFFRDEKGNLVEYQKDGRTIFVQEFDLKGRITKRTDFSGQEMATEVEYDDFGNVVKIIRGGNGQNKRVSEYEYDKRNRVTKISVNGKVISSFVYDGKITERKDYNGLVTQWLTNGRKDVVKVIQKDTVTGTVHQTRIEYDRRHLPVKVFVGNCEKEKLINGYLYTAEGKIKAEILFGEDSEEIWIICYEYKNARISEIKKVMVSRSAAAELRAVFESGETSSIDSKLKILIKRGGENVFVQKYDYRTFGQNKKLLTVTDGQGITNLFEYDSFGNLVKTTDGNGEISQIRYSKGRLEKEQSFYGGWYEYDYSGGILTSAKEDSGVAAKAEYFPDGSLKKATDRYGKQTLYHYDEHGRVRSFISENKKVLYEYDDFDRIIKQSVGGSSSDYDEQSDYFVTYEYSEDGRSATVVEGGRYETTLILDAFGNVVKQIDGNTNERSFVYDKQNRTIKSYDGYGNLTSYEYNALGLVSGVTDALGNKTKYSYDACGNVTKITDGEGLVYSAAYDKSGRLVRERSRGEVERSYEYDGAGRVIKVLCGGQVVESYSYGEKGRTVIVTDGNGKKYFYEYDGFGRLVNEKNRLGDVMEYFYDADGALQKQNNFDGTTSSIVYNGNRSERRVVYADGSENRFVYNSLGNIILAENEYARTEYTYDQGGRLICQKESNGETVTFSYDEAGNRVKVFGAGQETTYRYGKNNELLEVSDRLSRLGVRFEYDAVGRENKRTFVNGTVQKRHYDSGGRLTLLVTENSSGKLLSAEGYIYGMDGKRVAKVSDGGGVTLYEYDSCGRLSSVWNPPESDFTVYLTEEAEENGLPLNNSLLENKYLDSKLYEELSVLARKMNCSARVSPLQVFIREQYEYDGNSNRVSKTTNYGTIKYWYDAENRLLATGSNGVQKVIFTYDKNGNLLKRESDLKTEKFAYNAKKRMIYSYTHDTINRTSTETRYIYDAFGRRFTVQDNGGEVLRSVYDGFTFDVLKESPTFADGLFTDTGESSIKFTRTGKPTGDRYRYLDDEHDDGNRYFYLDEGTWKNVSSRYAGARNVLNAGGEKIAQYTQNGREYFSSDEIGTILGATDDYGSLKESYSYDAFGTPLAAFGSKSSSEVRITAENQSTQSYGYAGKPYDFATGLYDYGFRDYSPTVARFTTVDPIRDGSNWFSYCNGDPVNFVDLWGFAPRNMSPENREVYMNTISRYQNYVNNSNEMGIPDNYDCADTMTYLYGQGTTATSLGNLSGNLTHNGNPIGANIINIQSSDFFPSQTNNITFYSDKNFNNPNVEVGTVLAWQGPGVNGGAGWIGHTATVVDVSRDSAGNVTNIKIIQGHTGGNRTEVVDIPNQADLDSYAGTFLGFGELGENSTTPLNNPASTFKNK